MKTDIETTIGHTPLPPTLMIGNDGDIINADGSWLAHPEVVKAAMVARYNLHDRLVAFAKDVEQAWQDVHDGTKDDPDEEREWRGDYLGAFDDLRYQARAILAEMEGGK